MEKGNEKYLESYANAFSVLPLIRTKKLEKHLDKILEWWMENIMGQIPGLLFLDRLVKHYWVQNLGFTIVDKVATDMITDAAKKQGLPQNEFLTKIIEKYM